MNIIIATIRSYNISNFYELRSQYPEHNFFLLDNKDELNTEYLEQISPDFIFFPHWSWIIPEKIHNYYNCVVFHMTDLPFGRGGSPLQNLIVRGIYDTKISAIKVRKGIDDGDIYFKEPIDISSGNADEILQMISKIVFFKMIPQFFSNVYKPYPQQGEPVVFKRRTEEQSEIPKGLSKRQLYDYIRMLDGEGYPPAYINTPHGKMIFRNARLINNKLLAEVEIG